MLYDFLHICLVVLNEYGASDIWIYAVKEFEILSCLCPFPLSFMLVLFGAALEVFMWNLFVLAFIWSQYAEKLFVRKPKDNQYPCLVTQQIWDAVRTNDKKAVYRCIVSYEADVNVVYEQTSCNSSLTLAKIMLLQEQTSLDHSSRCLTGDSFDKSSVSSSNAASTSEGQTMDEFDGWSLLHLACETADIGMLELLLQYGANINACDSRGQMPLHRCILRGKSALAKLLLSRWYTNPGFIMFI